jgi:predicted ATPase
VTHSEKLARAFAQFGGVTAREVIKRNGETWIEGLRLVGDFKDEQEEDV